VISNIPVMAWDLWARLRDLPPLHQQQTALVIGGIGLAIAGLRLAIWPLLRALYANHRERRISALNERLQLPIAPFKLAERRVLIAELILSAPVQQAIADDARQSGKSVADVTATARRYAREIVPAFSATVYFRVGAVLARWVSRALYRVRVARPLAAVAPGASVVFVINHRSNIDYILVTHLIASSSALSYAVGEWARATGVAQLIRLMGAYFLRRDSGNVLYRRVLSSYVHRATSAGVTQAIFPEGGLSRTGGLQPAKLGLLSYMVADFDSTAGRDIVFVPVGLNYDRVLEDRVLIAAAAGAAAGQRPKFGFSTKTLATFAWRNIAGRITGRWYRFSYACVSFGEPVSLRAHLAARQIDLHGADDATSHAEINVLGQRLIGAVGHAVPVLPVSLVAFVLAAAGLIAPDRVAGASMSTADLRAACHAVMQHLEDSGVTVYIPRDDRDYAVMVGSRTLTLRHLIHDDGERVQVVAGQEALLAFYANGIAHHFGHPGWRVAAVSQPAAVATFSGP
jgi:glycerol-3-phosphate O-acyltransferase